MPINIKIIVSVLAALVVGGFSYTNLDGIHDRIGYLGFALATLMIVGIWLFPETGKVPLKQNR